MLIVFQCGTSLAQYANRSVIRRMDGLGGKIYVPRAMYSLRMSFCTVPRSLSGSTPCSLPTAIYIASRIAAGALIVILVETLSSGIPSNSRAISLLVGMLTPTLPTSPSAIGSSES
jgi:hypothetical protein